MDERRKKSNEEEQAPQGEEQAPQDAMELSHREEPENGTVTYHEQNKWELEQAAAELERQRRVHMTAIHAIRRSTT